MQAVQCNVFAAFPIYKTTSRDWVWRFLEISEMFYSYKSWSTSNVPPETELIVRDPWALHRAVGSACQCGLFPLSSLDAMTTARNDFTDCIPFSQGRTAEQYAEN